jgi:glycosyltransferase involved in cell wall biosynthesis
LRRSRRRPTLAIMVHEPYVPMTSFRLSVMGLWQRAQLQAIRASVDTVFASIEKWTDDLGQLRPSRPTLHLPVSSTLPNQTQARGRQRARLGIDDNMVVLTALGKAHPSRPFTNVVASANAVASRLKEQTVLFNLGSGLPALSGLDKRVALHQPGALSSVELAQYLAAGDVFLAPFTDGVSTRRTTLMAALQHSLAVVGTDGVLTDTMLRRAHSAGALHLVPVDEPEVFSDAVVRLAETPDERRSLSERGRLLYSTSFDWPVLTETLLKGLG